MDTEDAREIEELGPEGHAEAADASDLTVPATVRRRLSEVGVGALWALYALLNVFPSSHEGFAPWLVGPFCVLASLHFLARAFDPRPRLVVDGEGIWDRTSIAGGQLHIPWHDILGVTVSKWRGTVEVEVRDFDELCRTAGLRRRIALHLGALFGKHTVSIVPTLLGLNREQLRKRLDKGLLEFERTALGLSPEAPSLPGGAGK